MSSPTPAPLDPDRPKGGFDETARQLAELVPLERLKLAGYNPRDITSDRFRNLCKSIQDDPEFMWDRPILALADGTIIAGNQRYAAVKHLGWGAVPAIVRDIPSALAKSRMVRDNAHWGDWENEELGQMLRELDEAGSDISTLGFDEKRLSKLLEMGAPLDVDGEDGDAEDDDADETPSKYMIVVECTDEQQQSDLLERLMGEGFEVRALLSG